MQYKINEVSKITGVPIDTLRYFEKIGVITPKVNEENGYRYYEAWDINFILDYNNYRKLEFSSKEALHFVHEASLSEQIEALHRKSSYYEDKIRHYSKLRDRNEEIIRQVKEIPELLNKVKLVETPGSRYICYRENYDFYGFKQNMDEIHAWLRKIELTENVVIIPRETVEDVSENRYRWGMMIGEDDFAELAVPDTDNVEKIEPGLCVTTLVEAGGEGTFHYSLLAPALEYIRKHRFRLSGDPYGVLIIRSHDETGIHRFFNFYLPISE